MKPPLVIPEALSISCCCFSFSPNFGYLNAANAVDNQRKRHAVSFIGHLPIKHVFNLMVTDAGNNLRHNVRADIATITHHCC